MTRGFITGWLVLLCATSLGAAAPPPPPAAAAVVGRGERVTLFARAGSVEAQVPAEALQEGRPGDAIRVRNLQNGKVQTARVIAAGRVEIEVPQ